MLRLDAVTLSPGGHDVVVDAAWHLREGEHIGLVGRNGAGKTTLLRALAGEMSPSSGKVLSRNGLRIGYLPQQAVSGSSLPVWVEASSRMERLGRLEEAMQHAQAQIEAEEPGAIQKLSDATEAYRIAGGFRKDQLIGEVLHGLGFTPETWHNSCDTFSGGWQMRIALARMLLSEPDVALLDEPTNHLDMTARSWLATYLAGAPWAFVVVSHDRHLLDVGVNRIVEVRGKRTHVYAGNFTKFLVERELRAQQIEAAAAKLTAERAHLQSFVDRFGAKATKAAQAKSKQKALDRLGEVEQVAKAPPLPRFVLPEAPPGAFETIILENVSVGWGDTPVVAGIDLVLERGMRLALLGPNGCGKSTLLQTLAGRLPPLAGRRRLGDRTRIGVFDQDLAATLPEGTDALAHLVEQTPATPPQKLRAVLGALGLPGDMSLRPIGQLSGGEKARVALAALVVRPCNVLLLDEPTNHLDAETVEVLVRALADFAGALLLVTHDRYLVEKLATHVGVVEDGALRVRAGVTSDDLAPGRVSAGTASTESVAAESHAARKLRQREQQRAERQLATLEDEITALEERLAAIDEELFEVAADRALAEPLEVEQRNGQASLDSKMEEWEALGERIQELAAPE